MNVLTSPICPACRQPFTGIYRGRRGCSRCVTLGPVVAPAGAVRKIVEALTPLLGAEHQVTKGVETVATAMEQLATTVPA